MATDSWPTRNVAVASLHLDAKNPRLGREIAGRSPQQIILHLFKYDDAGDIADSISRVGYFANEPLLAVREGDRHIVVEGNRRLAALKALREPGLLGDDAKLKRYVDKCKARITNPPDILKVPVTIAPSRRATDKLIAYRHTRTPVQPWEAENRASFILEKLGEGYDNDELQQVLGFSPADIQDARQTRAIAEMARSIDLDEEIKAKLSSPRAKVFTTLKRIFESEVGRRYLLIKRDATHGVVGETTKAEFLRGFTRLVSDLALGKATSRTFNNSEQIETYFKSWPKSDLPKRKQGSFVPADVITGASVASQPQAASPKMVNTRSAPPSLTVLPRDLKVRFGGERLREIRNELTRLQREKFRNCGAVMLRVFLELSIIDYLKRTNRYDAFVAALRSKGALPQHHSPQLKQLAPEISKIAKSKLKSDEANRLEKALRYDASAPFTISDLNSFVHSPDLPSGRDIEQFWSRTAPLFRLMLENDSGLGE